MKKLSYILLCGLMLILSACEKDTESSNFAPVATTGTASNIYRMGATLSGSITLTETNTAKEYGILFSELESMAEYDEYPVKDASSNFSVQIKNLEPGTTYYYCAYASSGYSIAKSEKKSFTTTESNAPVFNDVNLLSKDEKSCKVSVNILDDGDSDIIMSGFVWKEVGSGNPTIQDNVTNAQVQNNSITATIIDMEPNKSYLVRAYAANAVGIGYSNTLIVNTNAATTPFLSEVVKIDSTRISITIKSSIKDSGSSEVSKIGFCYSSESKEPTTSHIVVDLTDQLKNKEFVTTIDDLNPETTYYFRAFAINDNGIGYSDIIEYTTAITIPSLSNIICVDSTEISVTLKSGVVDMGLGEVSKIGFCYSFEKEEPTIEHNIVELTNHSNIAEFVTTIDKLNPQTTYYFRAFASNETGTGYSNIFTYTTPDTSFIEGDEGDVYVAEAGGLNEYVNDYNKYGITKLKISGFLNGDDFLIIRDMANYDTGNLTYLDISEANIVEGGRPYYFYNYTEDNVIGLGMFCETVLEEIILPQNITSIEDVAFTDCKSLKNIVIPEGVTSLGNHVFRSCHLLEKVVIPNSVMSIGEYCFWECFSLKEMNLPDNLTILHDGTFQGCSSLVNITLPNTLVSIEKDVFNGCLNLIDIKLPNSLSSIGENAFQDCLSVKEIVIPNNVTSINNNVFYRCYSLEKVVLPNTITSIGEMAFCRCIGLNNFTIPEKVSVIHNIAFEGCTALSDVSCNAEIPPTLKNEVFKNCTSLKTLHVPSGKYSAYNDSDWADWFLKITDGDPYSHYYKVTIETPGTLASLIPEDDKYTIKFLKIYGSLNGNDIRFIREMSGWNISNQRTEGCLIDLDISETTLVTGGDYYHNDTSYGSGYHYIDQDNVIGSYMFANLILNNIILPKQLLNLGDRSFRRTLLESIVIPNYVNSIGDQSFYDCSNLRNITIGSGVTIIENNAFADCYEISEVICNATIPPVLGSNVFINTSSSIKLIVPKGCKDAYESSDWGNWFSIIEEK